MASCSCSTRCRPVSAAPGNSSPTSAAASAPTSWRWPRRSAAAFRSAPASPPEAAKGMTVGTHGSTFGGNPLAMAAAGALLDVVLADGFLERVRRTALVLKQKLAEIKDRHPAVIAEVRGEGLLIGLRAVVPSADLVDELRAEKMITVAAGDNVVRLLPPLIVSEDEVAEAVRRIDRACARIAKAAMAREREAAG